MRQERRCQYTSPQGQRCSVKGNRYVTYQGQYLWVCPVHARSIAIRTQRQESKPCTTSP